MSPSNVKATLPGLITKETPHPFSVMLLGEVVGVQWSGTRILFFYADGHKAFIQPTKGILQVGDYEVPTC